MANVRKKLVVCLMVLVVISSMALPASAAEHRVVESNNITINGANYVGIVPFWANTASASAGIAINQKTINASAVIIAQSTSASIKGTLYLEKYSGGKWVTVTSWSYTGTGSAMVGKTYTGTSGVTYRTRTTATITANGRSETVECVSASKTV